MSPPISRKALASPPPPPPPALAVRAVLAARRALLRAADALVPPEIAMLGRLVALANGHVVAELARLRVADLVEERPLTAVEIAEKTTTNADAMRRTMRAAVATGLFARDEYGRFTNNRASSALRSGDTGSVRSFFEYFGSRSNVSAWADFRETLRTGKNAFERVHGKSVWSWFDEHPDEREVFAHSMTSLTLLHAPGIAAIYPFDRVDKLCDVGGGRGTLLSEILRRHGQLRAVLYDGPGVLDSARDLLRTSGVLDRVELVAGSFFDGVPEGCDVYMMKNVLHDWDDSRCITILKRCRAAMDLGRKLLVIEALVEETTDDFGAFSDLQMMTVCCEGRERGRADFARLFEGSGFRLGRVVNTPTSIAILEAIAI